MRSDRELFAQIAADPEAAAPYLVLADALQQRGDPRGELIAIQVALESASPAQTAELRRREGEALLAHASTWIPLDADIRKGLVVQWRYGFLHAARVLLDRKPVDTLRALLAMPEHAATLAELRLGPITNRKRATSWPELEPVLEILRARWPAGLRRLFLNEGDLHGLERAPPVILDGLGPLDLLVVQSRDVAIRSLPALRRLEIRSADFTLAALPASATLEELEIWARAPGALAALTPARFPRLRRLAFVGTVGTDELAARLGRLPVLPQLAALDLTGGTLTEVGLRSLVPVAKRLALDVKHNLIAKRPRGFGHVPQRKGTSSWLEPSELARLGVGITSGSSKVDPIKRYRRVVAAAARTDPCWGYALRLRLARDLEPEVRGDTLSELASEWEGGLAVELASRGAELYRTIGLAWDERGELIAAEACVWRALQAARWYADAEEEQRALGQIATLRMRRGDPGSAAPILARLAEEFRASGRSSSEAWAVRHQGNVELTRSDFGRAEQFYRRALELYRAARDHDSEAIVLSELSSVSWSRGDYAGAETMLRDALKLRDPESLGVGSTYYNLGAILNAANRIDDALEAAERSLEVSRRHRHRVGEGQALSLMGELYQRKNEHAKAQTLLDEALACHRAAGALPRAGVTLGNLSRVALDLGDYAGARAYCDEALEIHREVGNKYNEGMQAMGLADAWIGERELDRAREALDQAHVALVAIANGPGIAAVELRRGIVDHLAGDPDAARRHYDRCATTARAAKYDELIGWADLWIAVLHAQAREHDRAREVLARARTTIPRDSIQGNGAIAMTAAAIGRLGGATTELPRPQTWDERILARLCE